MKVFKEELDKFEVDRQDLANAERLFDLPITMYPELLSVQKEMKGLEMIYILYVEQKVRSIHIYCHLSSIYLIVGTNFVNFVSWPESPRFGEFCLLWEICKCKRIRQIKTW